MANLLHFNIFLLALVFLYSSVAAILPLVPYPFHRKILLPSPAFGPDSIAFTENNTEIAYVSVSDGRVLKLDVKDGTFQDFAYTSPERTKENCDGNTNTNLAATCGKVFGLSMDNINHILYAVDAYRGLFSIQIPQGDLATPITNTAGGQPLTVSAGIDVDPTTGDVYFVDSSLTLNYSEITQPNVVLDSTGRLIKYNPKTKQVTVLLSELYAPSGPAVSFDGSFVLIPLLGNSNIIKYYIKGFNAGKSEVLTTVLGGTIRKIKRASTLGDFWVAFTRLEGSPSINIPFAYKFNSFGIKILEKNLSQELPNTRITTIQQNNPLTIFVGSRLTNYITEYSYCETCL